MWEELFYLNFWINLSFSFIFKNRLKNLLRMNKFKLSIKIHFLIYNIIEFDASVSFILTKCCWIWYIIISTTHLLHLPFPKHFTYRFRHYWFSIIYLLKISLLILDWIRETLSSLLRILKINLILWVYAWRISIRWMIILTNRWSIIVLII